MADRATAEIVVVGAGPAGIAATCRAAEAGAEVVLVDEGPHPGGQIWRRGGRGRPPPLARRWLERLRHSGARRWHEAAVVDAQGDLRLLVEQHGERRELAAGRLILATGARELFLPFPGWTLPGVVGVGAAQALLKSGARFDGVRVVLAGAGPLSLSVAAALTVNGADVRMVAEQAPAARVGRFALGLWSHPSKLIEALRYRLRFWSRRYRCGTWAVGATGDQRLQEVELRGRRGSWREPCDLLGCAYGLVPNTELGRLLGCGATAAGLLVDDRQQTTVPGVFSAGEANGIGGAELAVVEGQIAAAAATGELGGVQGLAKRRRRLRSFARRVEETFHPRRELAERLRPDTIVCRCEDVSWERLDPGWGLRQAKLYTRVGMGACQGRVCGPALGFLCGWSADTVRPPLQPTRLRSLTPPPAASSP